MYVKDGIVFALYQDYGDYIYDQETGTETYVQTSQVVVIDASQPADMTELSRFAVPGFISDSRIVGDVLYVAAFENGYCWSCAENQPRTTVVSLDVRDPANVDQVDQLSFDDNLDSYGWKRSISVTDERMYVAGPEWGQDGPVGSTIQVVDISDPAGNLVEGASVQVTGQVNSRWQMDEYEGVLRVISQPFEWDLTVPPHVETFRIHAADDLEALGDVTLTLPRPEQLQSVRFDGPRGYAITFERTDPLFTIDLSDPAAPVQAGMLEMPGWLYHMEPRGDRLVGLGFDQDNPDGALAVSLFDVSDLNEPVMLDRANFGGDWGWMVEDQDRIHKAFRLLDEAGLILTPFSGWVYPEDDVYGCYGNYVSGVQLIDWQNDELEARGVAKMSSEARRGFLHDERLVTVSDDRVEVFDISDRDAPTRTGQVAMAQYVRQTVAAGDRALRVGQNWYSNETEVDVVPLDEVSTPRAEVGLEVGLDDAATCQGYAYTTDILASEDRAYLVSLGKDGSGEQTRDVVQVATLDLGESITPELAASVGLDVTPSYTTRDYSLPGMGKNVVRVGEALVFNHQVSSWNGESNILTESGMYVVDLSDPTEPKSQFVELPLALGASALFVDGNVVARSHYVAPSSDKTSVKFYLERLDVKDPAKPRRLPSLNVPGSVIALSGDRAFTVDFEYRVRKDVLREECYQDAQVVSYEVTDPTTEEDLDRGTCTSIVQVLTLIRFDDSSVEVLGSKKLQSTEMLGQTALGDDVMFVTTNHSYYYYEPEPMKVLTLGGLAGGDFTVGSVEGSQEGGFWYGALLAASGKRAFVTGGWTDELTLLDASDPEHPEVVRGVSLGGYLSDLTVIGSTAVVSLGYDGVEAVSFRD